MLFGNPNVLDKGATRNIQDIKDADFGLTYSNTYNLKVVYEAKYIQDIDPVDAMKSIIDNLLSMGSSPEVIFRLGDVGKGILEALDARNPTEMWKTFKDKIITPFINAITETTEQFVKKVSDAVKPSNTSTTEKTEPDYSGLGGLIKTAIGALGDDIFASTIAKYRWPLRGVYGVHTGESTTPWHMTIGNPLAPVLSLNHIIVKSVNIKADSKEYTIGDIPKYVEATINVEASRDMGIDVVSQMFFRNHIRTYESTEIIKSTLNNSVVFSSSKTTLTEEEKKLLISTGRDGMKNENKR